MLHTHGAETVPTVMEYVPPDESNICWYEYCKRQRCALTVFGEIKNISRKTKTGQYTGKLRRLCLSGMRKCWDGTPNGPSGCWLSADHSERSSITGKTASISVILLRFCRAAGHEYSRVVNSVCPDAANVNDDFRFQIQQPKNNTEQNRTPFEPFHHPARFGSGQHAHREAPNPIIGENRSATRNAQDDGGKVSSGWQASDPVPRRTPPFLPSAPVMARSCRSRRLLNGTPVKRKI